MDKRRAGAQLLGTGSLFAQIQALGGAADNTRTRRYQRSCAHASRRAPQAVPITSMNTMGEGLHRR